MNDLSPWMIYLRKHLKILLSICFENKGHIGTNCTNTITNITKNVTFIPETGSNDKNYHWSSALRHDCIRWNDKNRRITDEPCVLTSNVESQSNNGSGFGLRGMKNNIVHVWVWLDTKSMIPIKKSVHYWWFSELIHGFVTLKYPLYHSPDASITIANEFWVLIGFVQRRWASHY